jgi:hypothetical protein
MTPSLLRQIVLNTLEVEGRVEIVGCGEDDAEEDINLAEAIHRYGPDVIVTNFSGRELDPAFEHFLSERPGRRVLTIESTGRSACLFSMQPGLQSLGEMSTDTLVKAIHGEFTEH